MKEFLGYGMGLYMSRSSSGSKDASIADYIYLTLLIIGICIACRIGYNMAMKDNVKYANKQVVECWEKNRAHEVGHRESVERWVRTKMIEARTAEYK